MVNGVHVYAWAQMSTGCNVNTAWSADIGLVLWIISFLSHRRPIFLLHFSISYTIKLTKYIFGDLSFLSLVWALYWSTSLTKRLWRYRAGFNSRKSWNGYPFNYSDKIQALTCCDKNPTGSSYICKFMQWLWKSKMVAVYAWYTPDIPDMQDMRSPLKKFIL